MNYCATRKATGTGEAPEYTIHYVCNNLFTRIVTWMDVFLTEYSSRKPILKKRGGRGTGQTKKY